MEANELYNVEDVIQYQVNRILKSTAKFIKNTVEYSELKQIAYLGYLKARRNYKAEYGQMSLDYASKYIRQELVVYMKKEYKYIINHSDLEATFCEYEYNVPDEREENITASPEISLLQSKLCRLPEVQREVIQAFYFDEKPKRLVDLAKEKGVTKQRIHQIKEKGLKNLRKYMEGL